MTREARKRTVATSKEARRQDKTSRGTGDRKQPDKGRRDVDGSSSGGVRTLHVVLLVIGILALVFGIYVFAQFNSLSGTEESHSTSQSSSDATLRQTTETDRPSFEEEVAPLEKESQKESEQKEIPKKETSQQEPEKVAEPSKKATPKKMTTKKEATDKNKKKTKLKTEQKVVRVLQSPIPSSDKDAPIAKDLSVADKLLEKRRNSEAHKKFQELTGKFQDSVRAQYGLAMSVDQLADEQRSNKLLADCIKEYEKVWDLSDASTTADILKPAMLRLADRYGFMGQSFKGAGYLEIYLSRFPDDLPVMKELSVHYLMAGKNDKAKPVLERILQVKSDDGFALGHLGFIVKSELKYEEAIPLLYGGLRGDDDRSREGRFYFHLGDALQRLGRRDEAYKVYQEGADNGIFSSPWQRSLYNAPNLKAQSWWKPSETPYMKSIRMLEANWKTIRDEGLAVMNRDQNAFQFEDENLRETGDWKQLTLFMRGSEQKTCARVPKTCDIIRKIPDAAGCKRGQVKYSVMLPGTHVWPHTGPTNCRLRMHLGLVIPDNVRIRVGNDTGTWQEGKIVIIDDSIEHEVWHEGPSMRLIFIVDVWHPDLSDYQKQTLSPI